ncbi:MAG: hypothetical protein KC457_22825, partial [Myxococcales bacterium]|nr:hypothetical protein [Myxococcales bacterium]
MFLAPSVLLAMTALLFAPPASGGDPQGAGDSGETVTTPTAEEPPVAEPPPEEILDAGDDSGFFAGEVGGETFGERPEDVPVGSPGVGGVAGESTAPPMPAIEELPSRDPDAPDKSEKRPVIAFDPERGPAGSDGGSFFDPGKLADTGPGGGGIVQLR